MIQVPRGATVAFQGVHGAYSEMACRNLLGTGIKTLPCETFDAVFAAVAAGKARFGVLPIENSLAGSIHQNYDLLAQHDLPIVGETHLRVRHCLLCHPKTSRSAITEVRSHPQALAQCSGLFATQAGEGRLKSGRSQSGHAGKPALKPVVWFDTAGAAQSLVDEKPMHVAAIASELAAQLYGLKILDRHIANQPENFTRFLAITKVSTKVNAKVNAKLKKPAPSNQAATLKTSIAYLPPANEVGMLFKVLGVFALRGIDLLKIESRPDTLKPFEYRFYLDLVGDAKQGSLGKALDHLCDLGGDLKILGTYPADAGRPHA